MLCVEFISYGFIVPDLLKYLKGLFCVVLSCIAGYVQFLTFADQTDPYSGIYNYELAENER
jgi:hypothetical protein